MNVDHIQKTYNDYMSTSINGITLSDYVRASYDNHVFFEQNQIPTDVKDYLDGIGIDVHETRTINEVVSKVSNHVFKNAPDFNLTFFDMKKYDPSINRNIKELINIFWNKNLSIFKSAFEKALVGDMSFLIPTYDTEGISFDIKALDNVIYDPIFTPSQIYQSEYVFVVETIPKFTAKKLITKAGIKIPDLDESLSLSNSILLITSATTQNYCEKATVYKQDENGKWHYAIYIASNIIEEGELTKFEQPPVIPIYMEDKVFPKGYVDKQKNIQRAINFLINSIMLAIRSKNTPTLVGPRLEEDMAEKSNSLKFGKYYTTENPNDVREFYSQLNIAEASSMLGSMMQFMKSESPEFSKNENDMFSILASAELQYSHYLSEIDSILHRLGKTLLEIIALFQTNESTAFQNFVSSKDMKAKYERAGLDLDDPNIIQNYSMLLAKQGLPEITQTRLVLKIEEDISMYKFVKHIKIKDLVNKIVMVPGSYNNRTSLILGMDLVNRGIIKNPANILPLLGSPFPIEDIKRDNDMVDYLSRINDSKDAKIAELEKEIDKLKTFTLSSEQKMVHNKASVELDKKKHQYDRSRSQFKDKANLLLKEKTLELNNKIKGDS